MQCTLGTSAVLRHKAPPLKEIANYKKITATTGPIRITENSKVSIQVIHNKNGVKIKGVQRAGGMRQVKPAGL